MKNLLQNKYVLYLVLFLAITNVLGYLAIEDSKSVMVFIAISALASYFSKNMIIILGSAILGTNVIYANGRMIEGMKSKKVKKTKKKAGFKSRFPSSRPAKAAGAEEDDEVDTSRIDYAATMEQAYDNLNNMLGEGGMQNLTKDTKGLMDQQKDLMKQLKDFAPLMEQAGGMLDKLGGMDNLKGLMGKMGGISLPNGKKK